MILATPDSDIAPVTEGAAVGVRALNRVQLGHVSEKAFDLEATKRGWLVAANSGGGADFDFIIKRPHILRPVVVQVKKAKLVIHGSNNCHYKIRASRHVPGQSGLVNYSETAFDVLAAHLSDIDSWVFYTRAELLSRTSTTYSLPQHRKNLTKCSAPTARNPNNWELLDDVAQSLTNSGSGTANVPPPVK